MQANRPRVTETTESGGRYCGNWHGSTRRSWNHSAPLDLETVDILRKKPYASLMTLQRNAS